jgi:hypothetical protein
MGIILRLRYKHYRIVGSAFVGQPKAGSGAECGSALKERIE